MDNSNKKNSLYCHIESVKDVSRQLDSLRSYEGFYEEGETFDRLEFNYFMFLQSHFMQNKKEPVKFHSLIDTLPSYISVQGKRYQLKNNRTCLWDGSRLYLLSQYYVNQGSFSCFRRIVMIPQSEKEELHFYAMLGPIQQIYKDSSELKSYLASLRYDYEVSQLAYTYLYPYVRPRLIEYRLNENYMGDFEDKLPALLTRSYSDWHTLAVIINKSKSLTEVGFLSILGWMLSVMIMHEQSCLHRDLSDNNVLVHGPGVFCQLIDMSSVTRLAQNGEVEDFDALSTYPDFTSRFGVHDKLSDVFSLAFNLIRYKVFQQKLWSESELNDLFKKTHYHYKEEADFQVKLKRYERIYEQIKRSKPVPTCSMLLPHLLNLSHPDRSSRSTLIDVFSDKKIMHTIRDHIYTIGVISRLSVYFVTIKNWSLQRVISDLSRHADDTSVASAAILMLLVYALHYEKLPNSIRINHKQHIECVLDHLNVTPFQSTVILHYESEFPGHLTKSLYFDCIDSLIDQTVSESINEYIDISSVMRELCDRTYNHVVQEQCNDVLHDLVNQVVIRDESEVLLNKLMDIIEYRQKDSEDFIQQVIEAVINQIFDDINSRETTQLRSQLHESLMIMFITPLLLSLSVKYYKIDSMDSPVFFLSLWITSFVLVLCNLNQFGNNIKLHLNESYLPSRLFKPPNHCVPHGMSSPQISLPTV